jgi:DNA-binding phage protein
VDIERLSTPEKQALAAFIAMRGHRQAAAALGIARMTIYRALEGQASIRPGTATQIRLGLRLSQMELKP